MPNRKVWSDIHDACYMCLLAHKATKAKRAAAPELKPRYTRFVEALLIVLEMVNVYHPSAEPQTEEEIELAKAPLHKQLKFQNQKELQAWLGKCGFSCNNFKNFEPGKLRSLIEKSKLKPMVRELLEIVAA